jgi:hypothetical protein
VPNGIKTGSTLQNYFPRKPCLKHFVAKAGKELVVACGRDAMFEVVVVDMDIRCCA